MNTKIRNTLSKLIAEKNQEEEPLSYKSCKQIASHIGCSANTLARLLALEGFKPTHNMKQDLEERLAQHLGFGSVEEMEDWVITETAIEDFRNFMRRENK